MTKTLPSKELTLLDAYWRAANYLSVGQIYLYDNPLLKKSLTKEHIKPRLLGHWGTTPGLNFIYAHLNRIIKAHDLDMLYTKGDIPQRESGLRYLRRTVGTDKSELRAGSPTALADKVGIPVLLVAGARDQRAVPEQTEAMRDALTKAGNPPVDTLIQSGEMHGFYKEENNLNLYTKMLDFFGKHIGGTPAH